MNNDYADRRGPSLKLTSYIAHERTKMRANKSRTANEAVQQLKILMTDKLTGLPSNLALAQLIETFDPSEYPPDTEIFCVYFDLIGVKNINDKHGHAKGDKYIQQNANAISSCFRTENGEDLIFRPTGIFRQHETGDEFIAFLTCPKDTAEKLQGLIEERLSTLKADKRKPNRFRHGISHSPLPSIGSDNQIYFDDLIEQADLKANQSRDLHNN